MNWLTLLAPPLKLLEPKSSPEEEDLWATVSSKLQMNKMLKRLFKPWTRKTSMADKSTLRLPDPEKKVNSNKANNSKKEKEDSSEEDEEAEEEEEVLVEVSSEVASEEDSLKKENKENKNKKIDQEEEEDSVVPEEAAEVVSEEERPLNLVLTLEPSPRPHSLLLTCHFLLTMLLLERSSLMLVLNSRLLTL